MRARIDVNHFSFWAQRSLWQVFVSVWLHAYAFPLFDLEERGFFPLFLVEAILYGYKSLSHRCWGTNHSCFSLEPYPGSSQASRLPQQSMMLPFGQEPVSPHPPGHHRDERHFLSIQTCTGNGTGDCQAGKENAVRLNRDVRPYVSQRSLPPSAAERQRSRFTGGVHKPAAIMLKNINKMREKAYRVKLSF